MVVRIACEKPAAPTQEGRRGTPLNLKTFRKIFGYNDLVIRRKPVLRPGDDLRDLPTYTLAEAALFLAVPQRTMHYWFCGPNHILSPAGKVGEIALLSFRDIAEAYVLELLRNFYNFHPNQLRDVVNNFKIETKVKRPLLESDLYVVLGNIVLKKPARGRQPSLNVDLAHGRNLVFDDFVKTIGKRILTDRKRSPLRIFPWRLASQRDESQPVSMDPHVLSGRLVVTGTRVPVRILLGMKLRGKTIQEISHSYHLNVDAVEKALLHIERPIHQKAA